MYVPVILCWQRRITTATTGTTHNNTTTDNNSTGNKHKHCSSRDNHALLRTLYMNIMMQPKTTVMATLTESELIMCIVIPACNCRKGRIASSRLP